MTLRIAVMLVVGASVLFAPSGPGLASTDEERPSTVDFGALATELMRFHVNAAKNQMAIWLPQELFVEGGLLEPGQSRAAVESELEFLKPYLMIVVQTSIDQPDGTSVYSAAEDIRERAFLALDDGGTIRPMENVPPLVSAVIAAMKVLFASEGDAGGENMHVLVFPGSIEGVPIVNTTERDELHLVLIGNDVFPRTEFVWKTPFDALAGDSSCGHCGKETSRQWSFCPWCGKKLEN
jgi:hypothetical protein